MKMPHYIEPQFRPCHAMFKSNTFFISTHSLSTGWGVILTDFPREDTKYKFYRDMRVAWLCPDTKFLHRVSSFHFWWPSDDHHQMTIISSSVFIRWIQMRLWEATNFANFWPDSPDKKIPASGSHPSYHHHICHATVILPSCYRVRNPFLIGSIIGLKFDWLIRLDNFFRCYQVEVCYHLISVYSYQSSNELFATTVILLLSARSTRPSNGVWKKYHVIRIVMVQSACDQSEII